MAQNLLAIAFPARTMAQNLLAIALLDFLALAVEAIVRLDVYLMYTIVHNLVKGFF